MKIVIPWEWVESKNVKYTRWSGGRRALSDDYRKGKDKIAELALEQMEEHNFEYIKDDKFKIVMVLFEPTAHHRDIFNYTQIVFDALEEVCYSDDYYIDVGVVKRGAIDRDNARVEVYIERVEE